MASWRQIVGIKEHYEVSDEGEVRSFYVSRRKPELPHGMAQRAATRQGHRQVPLRIGSRRIQKWVHRLVAEAFLGPPPFAKAEVNHIDGNPGNNLVSNLEWVSRRANALHASKLGRMSGRRGEHRSKLTSAKVEAVRWCASRGLAFAQIARRARVCAETVRQVVREITWKREDHGG